MNEDCYNLAKLCSGLLRQKNKSLVSKNNKSWDYFAQELYLLVGMTAFHSDQSLVL